MPGRTSRAARTNRRVRLTETGTAGRADAHAAHCRAINRDLPGIPDDAPATYEDPATKEKTTHGTADGRKPCLHQRLTYTVTQAIVAGLGARAPGVFRIASYARPACSNFPALNNASASLPPRSALAAAPSSGVVAAAPATTAAPRSSERRSHCPSSATAFSLVLITFRRQGAGPSARTAVVHAPTEDRRVLR
ncbi:hypothetical protein [Streptomyces sp. KN37]|uniref:hypothetical protein n=1 Tax=Streptomyces sp. KN37 TaxID=3090667 RepID=UPI002A75B7C0|nr:hypothetical protein [Streptomyces sp. KN37]WPO76734.1 hypothetical protein R9806_39630 [Streptomyces sp. KN37]